VEVLRAAGVGAGARFTVLGAGGTARAALAAAAALSAGSVTVVARRPEAVRELELVADAVGVTVAAVPWARPAVGDIDVLVSTVPKGAADELVDRLPLRPAMVCFDAIYDPWPTPLASAAEAAGCRVVSGLDLLLAQAVGQFEQFTGAVAPVPAMREALHGARSGRRGAGQGQHHGQ
jgi:shikimate dehydrogenase